jgi:hypothetical protein
MVKTDSFVDGLFMSLYGDAITVKFEDTFIRLSFPKGKKEIILRKVMKHWWVNKDYALRITGDSVELSRNGFIGNHTLVYRRVKSIL